MNDKKENHSVTNKFMRFPFTSFFVLLIICLFSKNVLSFDRLEINDKDIFYCSIIKHKGLKFDHDVKYDKIKMHFKMQFDVIETYPYSGYVKFDEESYINGIFLDEKIAFEGNLKFINIWGNDEQVTFFLHQGGFFVYTYPYLDQIEIILADCSKFENSN